ncbi:MAG: pyridoxal phosphate-dependent decarboxylase family protein [Actinomycetota bacterium]
MDHDVLEEVFAYARTFLAELPERRVTPSAGAEELRSALRGALPNEPSDPRKVIAELIAACDPGVLATTSGRFFGFVIGGATPPALAADWLTSTWDQNAGLFVAAPAASVVEEVAGRWLIDLFGLPEKTSFGFVTGGQMANFTCLAAARQHLLKKAGWDVEADGLQAGPLLRVVVGEERHATIDRALRFLGLGASTVEVVQADEQGRMRADDLLRVLESRDEPAIVCAQAGNVNSGSFDPIGEICDTARSSGAWVHVDGAFGLWAAASAEYRHLVDGVERADSWATDAHKWLNVPYDSGLAFCAHPEAHSAAMGVHASYLIHTEEGAERDEMDWNPEFSRRARGFPVYASMRALGRAGIMDLVERSCSHARRFADALASAPGVEVLNEVVLNQVIVRFQDDDAATRAVIRRVQEDGTCWLSGSVWRGKAVMRISVSNWATSTEDVDASVKAILAAARSVAG